MHSKTLNINIARVTSFSAILDVIDGLKAELPANDMHQFEVFNKAYFIVTKNIKYAADKGYFENPEFIEKFTACFARYYFDALNKTASKSRDLPEAWRLLTKAKAYAAPNFIYLLIGANAHINRDLPFALAELLKTEKTDDLFRDVLKIDKILMSSGREVISIFDEPNWLLNFFKLRFIFIYYRPVMYFILYWRIRAWRSYGSIKRNGAETLRQKRYPVKIAKRFLKAAKILNKLAASSE